MATLTPRQQECTREIPLTKGMVALVDVEDFERFGQFTWQAFKSGNGWYAVRRVQTRSAREPGGQAHKMLWLHREIMVAESGQTVDHANRDTLDNRRQNLRFCTIAQNVANDRPSSR